MITLSIDENNKHVLRTSASYLLALAGDISAEISGAGKPIHINAGIPDAVGEANFAKAHPSLSKGFALPDNVDAAATFEAPPAPSEVFAPPKPVPSTAGAEALPTAPVVTEAPTSPPPSIPASPPPAPPLEVAEAAPTAPVAPSNPAPAVELDADGLPWDARIHSETRSKVVAGTWKYKRGVDPRLVEQVEAELRGVMGLPAPAPAESAAEADISSVDGTTAPTSAPSLTPPAPTATGAVTFPQLMLKISKAVSEGRTTQVAVIETVKGCGIESLPLLAQRPDLVPTVDAAIDALLIGVAE